MNPLLRLESMLREAFERPIWVLGGQRLHPAQLGELLEDAMRESRVGLPGGTYIAERYVLLLSDDDVQRLGTMRAEMERGLAEHLDAFMRSAGYGRRAPIEVVIRPDAAVRPGDVEVDASFVEERFREPSLRMSPGGGRPPAPDHPPGATAPIDRRAVFAALGRMEGEEPSPTALAVLARLDQEGRERERYGVESLPCVIGRSTECDIMLLDLRVSRRQAELERQHEALLLRDLGSSNGTFVNDTPVTETVLLDGDVLTLGGPRFRLHVRS